MATFWVKATGKEDGKVLLWERHPDHPEGETYIANDGNTVEVSETLAVKQLLKDGAIERVNWNNKPIPVTPKLQEVVATDEDEEEVVARVEETPASKPIPNGGLNRGGRPPKRGQ